MKWQKDKLVKLRFLLLPLAWSFFIFAGDAPANTIAKITKLISSGKVASKDSGMEPSFLSAGCQIDNGALYAWASNEKDIISYKGMGKCVITNKIDYLSVGATIAIVEEEGRPQIYIHAGNMAANGVSLPAGVLKLGKRI